MAKQSKAKPPKKDAPTEHKCVECGYPIKYPGLCGECGCEDDCAIW
jgi:hypothetical protein